ncbi:WD repeat-containing protein 33 [Paramecium bursaria]
MFFLLTEVSPYFIPLINFSQNSWLFMFVCLFSYTFKTKKSAQLAIWIDPYTFNSQTIFMEFVLNFQQLKYKILECKQHKISQTINNHSIYQSIIKLNKLMIPKIIGVLQEQYQIIQTGGSDGLLKIWNYKNYVLMKSISFKTHVTSLKFNQDSKLLYVGTHQIIFLFHVQSNFKKLCNIRIHTLHIKNIFCITDAIILTSSRDKYIIKTDVILKQQLFKIQAHNFYIYGLDYSMKLNLIASGSHDKSIKLWNAVDGSLILEKLSTQNQDKPIRQVQFVVNKDQLVSLDIGKNLTIWNINYKAKQLEQIQLIQDSGFFISLVLQQKFIIVSNYKFFKFYTINGEFVRQLEQQVDNFGLFQVKNLHHFNHQLNNNIHPDPTNMVLVKGREKLYVLKLHIDPI